MPFLTDDLIISAISVAVPAAAIGLILLRVSMGFSDKGDQFPFGKVHQLDRGDDA